LTAGTFFFPVGSVDTFGFVSLDGEVGGEEVKLVVGDVTLELAGSSPTLLFWYLGLILAWGDGVGLFAFFGLVRGLAVGLAEIFLVRVSAFKIKRRTWQLRAAS